MSYMYMYTACHRMGWGRSTQLANIHILCIIRTFFCLKQKTKLYHISEKASALHELNNPTSLNSKEIDDLN